jgi:DNA-binding MarR family transcriptional regulator
MVVVSSNYIVDISTNYREAFMDITHSQITKIAREVNKFVVRTLKKDGIGSSEFDLIHVVRKHDGISQAGICRILGTDKGAVARQVATLVKRGYLRKAPDPKDGRASIIYATEKADQLKISKRHLEDLYYKYILEALSEEERRTFASLLERVYLRSKSESKGEFKTLEGLLERGAADE